MKTAITYELQFRCGNDEWDASAMNETGGFDSLEHARRALKEAREMPLVIPLQYRLVEITTKYSVRNRALKY